MIFLNLERLKIDCDVSKKLLGQYLSQMLQVISNPINIHTKNNKLMIIPIAYYE